MAKASNNEFPSVLFGEQASDPSTPSSSTVRLYFDTTARPSLKSIDDAADVATYVTEADALLESDLTAKGDIVVAATASSATVLSVASTDGYVLAVSSGAAAGLEWVASSGGGDVGLSAVTINAQTGTSYTLVAGDASKLVTLDNASTVTVTVPDSSSVAFDTGTRIALAQLGAGTVTVAETGSATVNADPGQSIAAQYGAAELIYYGSDNWLMLGRLST